MKTVKKLLLLLSCTIALSLPIEQLQAAAKARTQTMSRNNQIFLICAGVIGIASLAWLYRMHRGNEAALRKIKRDAQQERDRIARIAAEVEEVRLGTIKLAKVIEDLSVQKELSSTVSMAPRTVPPIALSVPAASSLPDTPAEAPIASSASALSSPTTSPVASSSVAVDQESKILAEARAVARDTSARSTEELIQYLTKNRSNFYYKCINRKDRITEGEAYRFQIGCSSWNDNNTIIEFYRDTKNKESACLEAIAVRQGDRKRGQAAALMTRMIDCLRQEGVKRIEFVPDPCSFGVDYYNNVEVYNREFIDLIHFYKKFGAVFIPENITIIADENAGGHNGRLRASGVHIDISGIPVV